MGSLESAGITSTAVDCTVFRGGLMTFGGVCGKARWGVEGYTISGSGSISPITTSISRIGETVGTAAVTATVFGVGVMTVLGRV